jgi:hypothetical protein
MKMRTTKSVKRRQRSRQNKRNLRGDILRDNIIRPVVQTMDLRTGYPDEMRLRMAISWIETLNTGAGATSNQGIRANSLYDPEYDFGGGQPTGFTQWSSVYGFYRVIQTWVRVTFMANGTTSGVMAVALFPSLQAGLPSPYDATDLFGIPRSKSSCVGFGNGVGKYSLNMTHSTEEIMGVYPLDQDYCGSSSTNPLRNWYYNFAVARTDGGTGGSITCHVQLEYEAIFFGRTTFSS